MNIQVTQILKNKLGILTNIVALSIAISASNVALSQPVTHQIVPIAPTNSTSIPSMPSGDITKIRFTITNLHDYDLCIDDILLLYEGRLQQHGGKSQCIANVMSVYGSSGLTKQQALELIELANFQATRLLSSKLYPPLGIRRRVAVSLGYIYDIDTNDPQIQALAARSGNVIQKPKLESTFIPLTPTP